MGAETREKVEAVLFASGRFIDEKRIGELIGASASEVKKSLKELQARYEENQSSLRIMEEEGAWKFHVQDKYLELISEVVSDSEVSGPVLETLAVIAWRSPVLQADVVHTRGSNTYEHVKELVERGFIVKEPEGRTYRLRITEKFFDYFDVEGRDDIRKMFKEVEEAHRKKEMEQELVEKRIAQALKDADHREEIIEEQTKLETSGKDVSIEDLDKVLEKSKQAREKFSDEIKELKPKDEPEDDDATKSETGDSDDEEMDADKAKAIREQVEADADALSDKHKQE